MKANVFYLQARHKGMRASYIYVQTKSGIQSILGGVAQFLVVST